MLATEQGEYDRAVQMVDESLSLYRELGDRHSIAAVLVIAGAIAWRRSDYQRAATLYGESLAIFRELGDARNASVALNNLGSVAKEQGRFEEARQFFQESLELKRELGDRRGIAVVLNNLGTMAHLQGNYERARVLAEEGLALLRELGDGRVEYAIKTLARTALEQGQLERARELYREGVRVVQSEGEKDLLAFYLEGLGRVAGVTGDARRAARLYGRAEALRESIGAPLSPAEVAYYARHVEAARASLDDTSFREAWQEGRSMSLEKAIAHALEEPPAS